jgi:FtsH-binding integral membrane protein
MHQHSTNISLLGLCMCLSHLGNVPKLTWVQFLTTLLVFAGWLLSDLQLILNTVGLYKPRRGVKLSNASHSIMSQVSETGVDRTRE